MAPEDNPADDRYELDQCIAEIKSQAATITAQSAELSDLRKRCGEAEAIVEAYTKWRDADEVFHKANDSFDPEWTGERLNAAIRESNQAKQELDKLLAARREQDAS